MTEITFERTDGGRYHASDQLGLTAQYSSDCVIRAIAIATATRSEISSHTAPYATVYQDFKDRGASPSSGVLREVSRSYLKEIGWKKVRFRRKLQTQLGKDNRSWFCGGKHLNSTDVPMTGRSVVTIMRHVFAMIDGVIYDTDDFRTRNQKSIIWRGGQPHIGFRCIAGLCVLDIWVPSQEES